MKQRYGNLGTEPMRYTRTAANNSQSYKSVTDNQPGKVFKDATGKLHIVPNKNKRKSVMTKVNTRDL